MNGTMNTEINTPRKMENQPELITLVGRIEEINTRIEKYIYEIENKLTSIMRLESNIPKVDSTKANENKECFASAMTVELNKYNEHCSRLRNALDHLGKLI